MEVSFIKNTASSPIKKNIQSLHEERPMSRGQKLDSISGNIQSGLKAAEADPEELLKQTVEASSSSDAINDVHDFNMSRIMELLSDPLLQEDI